MIRDFAASIININEYHRFKNKSIWKVLLYLIVVSLLSGLLFSGAIQSKYTKILLMVPENYDTKVPDFKIENGELKINNGQNTVIEKDSGAIIFDVTEKPNENSLDKYEYGLLLLKDKVAIKTSKRNTDIKYWKDFNFEGYDKASVRQMLGSIPSLLGVISLVSIIGVMLINLVISFLMTLALMLAKRLWKKEITFLQLFKMSAYSMTIPSVLIVLLSIFLGDRIGLTKYYYAYYLAGIYVLIALRRGEVKPKKEK